MDNLDDKKESERCLLRKLLIYLPKLLKIEGEFEKLEKKLKQFKNWNFTNSDKGIIINLDDEVMVQDEIREIFPLIYIKDTTSENLILKIFSLKNDSKLKNKSIEKVSIYKIVSDNLINIEQKFSDCLKLNGKQWESVERRFEIVNIL